MKNTIAICSTTALVSLLCSVGLPKSVNAATFTYNLGGDNIDATSLLYTTGINIDDPILTVTGSQAGVTGNVRRRSNGLGVFAGSEGTRAQIDGRNGGFEALLLSFDQTVSIVSASFTSANRNDGFELLVDGNRFVTLEENLNNNNPFDFSSFPFEDTVGSEFTFTVSQEDDDYRLESVTVSTTGIPESTSVLSLLAVGFIGLASHRKIF